MDGNIFCNVLWLLGGLALLVAGGELLVRGGVGIATKLKISPLVIGMTIVAFGTSAPEFLVSLEAALAGSPEIAIGNVIGSNIANIALILGVTALIHPIMVQKQSMTIDYASMMVATVLFGVFAFYFDKDGDDVIRRWEGAVLAACLILFIISQIRYTKKVNKERKKIREDNVQATKVPAIWLSIIFIVAACFGLAFGAKFLVQAASNIATTWGVSERVIAITIVAIGTSLPELVTSVIAAIRKQTDIAVGNIIGSNIFNLLCVIGFSSIIKPIQINWIEFSDDYFWMLGISILLFFLILPIFKVIRDKNTSTSKIKQLFNQGRLGRVGGGILFISYILYILLLLNVL